MNNLKKINTNLFGICLTSSFHGIPNFLNSKRLAIKILWLISTLVSACACISFLSSSIMKYLSYPIVTGIHTRYEPFTQFPTISICSHYWADRSFGKRNLTDIIIDCWYGINLTDCRKDAEKYFEFYHDDLFLDCFRFNSGRNNYGQSIPFQETTIGGNEDSLRIKIKTNASLAVWIHDPLNSPKMNYYNDRNHDMYVAMTSFKTVFVFEKLIDKKLRYPHNICLEDVELFKKNKTIIDFLSSLNRSLTRDLCVDISFAIDYLEKNPCNCTANATFVNLWDKCVLRTSVESLIDNRNISLSKVDHCSLDYYRNIFLRKIVNDYCPQQCEKTSYTVETRLKGLSGFENIVDFHAYYKSLKYTIIDQKPEVYLTDLISDIGGVIGAFLGISILSFVEIIEIIAEIFIVMYERKKRIQQENSKRPNVAIVNAKSKWIIANDSIRL